MAVPIKIQNIQTGLLSADKLFQSQKQLPELQRRLFEAEVQKHMEDIREQTQQLEKSEKATIDEKTSQQKRQEAREKKDRKEGKSESNTSDFIQKGANGKIKHLDVKI